MWRGEGGSNTEGRKVLTRFGNRWVGDGVLTRTGGFERPYGNH